VHRIVHYEATDGPATASEQHHAVDVHLVYSWTRQKCVDLVSMWSHQWAALRDEYRVVRFALSNLLACVQCGMLAIMSKLTKVTRDEMKNT